MKLYFIMWIKTKIVNVSNETSIKKSEISLFNTHKMHETFLGITRMVPIPEKQ